MARKKSIGFLKVFSICANCIISGFKFVESLCNFSLDKLLGVWYNGNFAPQERVRRDEKPNEKREGDFPSLAIG
jgi:hypothetical protein